MSKKNLNFGVEVKNWINDLTRCVCESVWTRSNRRVLQRGRWNMEQLPAARWQSEIPIKLDKAQQKMKSWEMWWKAGVKDTTALFSGLSAKLRQVKSVKPKAGEEDTS